MRVSAVSYLNALPLVYGLQKGPNAALWSVDLEVPSCSAQRLREGSVAFALMPVGALHTVPQAQIIGEYCIGATREGYSVCLCAHQPLSKIRKVCLDPHSRTSVLLAQVLARYYWKVEVCWETLDFQRLNAGLSLEEGVVLIGDKVFSERSRYRVCYDLAAEWHDFTGLPFVFAVWAGEGASLPKIEAALNQDLAWGVSRIEEAITYRAARQGLPCSYAEALRYLRENIDYSFTHGMREGLKHFLALGAELLADGKS